MAERERELSTVEMTVLGLTFRQGPCTTYAVMREFSTAASTFYKSRAGTTYSVVKRLVSFGLLSQTADQIEVTPAGLDVLRQWLLPPIPLPDVAHSADLVRLRFYFLNLLTREEQLETIDHALGKLHNFLATCESLLPEHEKLGDKVGVLAVFGSVMETRTRIEYLNIVRKWIESPPPDGEAWSPQLLVLAAQTQKV